MNLTWNNNAYYSGTSATSQGIAQVGTTAGTGFYLASNFDPGAHHAGDEPARVHEHAVGRGDQRRRLAGELDGSSVRRTTRTLHVRTDILSPVSNAGASIASITNDYDGDRA